MAKFLLPVLIACTFSFSRVSSSEEKQVVLKELWSFQDKGVALHGNIAVPSTEQEVSVEGEVHRSLRFLAECDNAVFLGGSQGEVYKIDADSGKVALEAKVDGEAARSYVNRGYLILLCARPSLAEQFTGKYAGPRTSECVVMSPATGKIESQLTCPSPLSSKILNYTVRLISGFRRGGVELSPEFVALRKEYVQCCRDLASRRDRPNPKDWDVEALSAPFSTEIPYTEGPFFWTYMLRLADQNEQKKPPSREFCLVKYSEDGKLLWKSPLPGLGMIAAQTQDKVFISSGMDIVCFNKEDGAELWKFPAIPDQSHGLARPKILLFQDYVAIYGENINRPDHPHNVERGEAMVKPQTDLILVRQDTGKEVFFHPFRDIAGDVFSGPSHICLVSGNGTAVCLGSPPAK